MNEEVDLATQLREMVERYESFITELTEEIRLRDEIIRDLRGETKFGFVV